MIALLFFFGGSVFTSLFYIFGKLGHNRKAKRDSKTKGYIFEPLHVLSIVLLFTGSASNVTGLSYGNQTMLAATNAFSLILNSLFALVILKESLTKMDMLGIAIAAFGSYLYMSIAKEKELDFT